MPANVYSLKLNGTTDWADLPVATTSGASIAGLGVFTWEAWVKPGLDESDPQALNRYLWAERKGWNWASGSTYRYNGYRFAVTCTKQSVGFGLSRSDTSTSSMTWYRYSFDFDDDRWHHIAFAARVTDSDAANRRYTIYIDGAKKIESYLNTEGHPSLKVAQNYDNQTPPSPDSNYINAKWIRLGFSKYTEDGSPVPTPLYWQGKVDVIRLWRIFREENAVSNEKGDLLNSPLTETDLVEEWSLEQYSITSPNSYKFQGGKTGALGTCYNTYRTSDEVIGASSPYGSTAIDPYRGTTALFHSDRPFVGNDATDVVAPTAPGTPTTSSTSTTGWTMAWTASSDNVYVQGYQIQVSTANTFNTLVTGYNPLIVGNSILSYTISDLTPATTYFWRIRSVDAAGNTSAWIQPSPTSVTTLTTADTTPPSAPVATSATNLSTNSFSANWNVATDNSGIQGYRLDVATDSLFVNYVPGYASRVVGNVTTYTVNENISPNTAYYYRVRSVDTSSNESLPSNTITLQSVAMPDTTPPNPVVLKNATSVERTRFVANWEEGIDNVAVTGYLLDVSLDSTFTQLVAGYSSKNVGNVTATSVTGLTPGQAYYYRVRAYDAAGNISSNTDSYIFTVTDQPQSGTLPPYALIVSSTLSAEIRQDTATTSYNPTTLVVQGTANAARKGLLSFDWTGRVTQGTPISARLKVWTTNTSAASFKIARTTQSWTSSVTWNTAPTIDTATALTLNPTSANTYTEIDVSSLLQSNVTTLGLMLYWNASAQTDDWQFDSATGENYVATLELWIDPQTAFEADVIDIVESDFERKNLLLNPNMQGSLTNTVVSMNSGTIASNTTHFYRGTKSAEVTPAVGTTNYSGVEIRGVSSMGGSTAKYFSGSVYVKGLVATSGSTHTVAIRVKYTDGTTALLGQTLFNTTTEWRLISVAGTTATATNKTLDYVYLQVFENSGTTNKFFVDAAIVREVASSGASVGGYFDGDTRSGGAWASSTDASYSTFSSPSLTYSGTYVGDSDDNATAALQVRNASSIDVLPSASATFSRTTKSFEVASVGNTLHEVLNLVENPSFEDSVTLWGAVGSSTIVQSTAFAYAGSKSLSVTKSTASSGWGCSYGSTRPIYAVATNVVRVTAALRVPTGMTVRTTLQAYNSSNVAIGTASTTDATGNDAWAIKTLSLTCPASTSYVTISFTTTASVTGTFYVDAVQAVIGSYDYPYSDGDSLGGRWAGVPHLSHSWKTIEYNTEYQTVLTITDPSGIFGSNPIVTQLTTGIEPTTSLTTQALQLEVADDQIVVVAPYLGDDNETSTAIIEYKRGDQSSWNRATTIYDRANKKVSALIAYLSPGTEYDVQVTFLDAVVYNTNPLQAQVFTTTTSTALPVVPVVSFGGFILQGPDDHPFWVTSHDSFSHPSRRVQVETLPRLDGGIEIQSLWGTRTIQLRGGVSGSTREELSDNLALLRKAFAQQKQRLVIDTLSDTNRYFTATCTNFGVQEIGGQNIRHVLWDAEFIAADPFRYESGSSFVDNIDMDNNETIIIQNNGDLFAEPIFTITTTSATDINVQLVNLTTGERMIPISTATIKNNDVLTMDTTRLSIKKNSVEVDYSGTFIRLVPGENVIKVTISPTTASISLSAQYQQRYL